jgi:hypothetical protein
MGPVGAGRLTQPASRMQQLKIGTLLAFLTLTSSSNAAVRLPHDYAAWTRVARCESGGWQVLGAAYPDPVGIDATNYQAFGGRPLPVGPVSLVNRVAVIRVADRFRHKYKIAIPDQTGPCVSW